MNSMRGVAVKGNMIMRNLLCQGSRRVCHLDHLIAIQDVENRKNCTTEFNSCQSVVGRILRRNIFHKGNLSLVSFTEEISGGLILEHETDQQAFMQAMRESDY